MNEIDKKILVEKLVSLRDKSNRLQHEVNLLEEDVKNILKSHYEFSDTELELDLIFDFIWNSEDTPVEESLEFFLSPENKK